MGVKGNYLFRGTKLPVVASSLMGVPIISILVKTWPAKATE